MCLVGTGLQADDRIYYRGNVAMPMAPVLLSQRGMTGERDPYRLKTGDLITASNVNYGVGNLAEKDGGSSKINSVAITGSPTVLTGHDWWPNPSTQRRVIATSDGKLLKDDMTGAYATTLKSGLTTNRITHMVDAGAESAGRNRKLFMPNGADPVQVLSGDGATTANLLTPPADWALTNQPTFMFPFRGVLVGGGNANDTHRIYASLASDHEDFTAVGTWTLSLYPGEGQKLVAGMTAFGRAFLWKYPVGVYTVNDSASAVSGWFAQPVSRQYGAAPTPHAVVQIDEAVVAFVSNTGNVVMMQESAGTLTGVGFTDLTRVLNLRTVLRENFNLARLDKTQARWYDERKQLHILYAGLGSVIEDRRLVIDFNEERTRTSIVEKDTNTCLWMELDSDLIPRPRSGDNAGFTWKLDQDSRNRDGSAYTFNLRTAPTDFSDISAEYMGLKILHRLHLEYESTGDFDIAVEVIVDGKTKGTLAFNMGPAGALLPFPLPQTLGGSEIKRRSRTIVGEGHYVSLGITESGLNNNPRLSRAWVEFDIVGANR